MDKILRIRNIFRVIGIAPLALISYDAMAAQEVKQTEQKKILPSSRKLTVNKKGRKGSEVKIQGKGKKKTGSVPVGGRTQPKKKRSSEPALGQGTEAEGTLQAKKKGISFTRTRLRNKWKSAVVRQGGNGRKNNVVEQSRNRKRSNLRQGLKSGLKQVVK
ncbi:MAG: hypothetical protein LBJ13_04005 [Puniceicoccales bacterium]|jgi:hypothetical protein|nr:hypothetical protein [Puniceicoccales bacterium]